MSPTFNEQGFNLYFSWLGEHLCVRSSPDLNFYSFQNFSGNELVQDKDRDVKYTVLLNRRNPLPSTEEEGDESTLLPFISKNENSKETIFTIENPPKEGFFKLQIYARRKPNKKGRLKIPLAANFLVECRHSTQVVTQPVGVRASFSIGNSSSALTS